jgi:D-alanyl-D-alanine carboxypeptidase/D-alanyl-D-alanine-endopeptidase (penicillin-binding protein 4)
VKRLLAGSLLVAWAAMNLVAVGHPTALAEVPSTNRLQTPVLSLRRIPDLLVGVVGQRHLATALDAALADPRFGGTHNNVCLVVQQGSTPLYSRNPTQLLIPASNLKLLTATAALDKLGPATQLLTVVRADRAPVGGQVTGNLYLVGGGDALLRTADYVASLRYRELIYSHLETLADQVKVAGVTLVTGGVVGDESRYDQQRYVPTWRPSYAVTGEVGPLSALSVNDGFLAFRPASIAARQPAEQAAATFAALLKARGVTVEGPATAGATPGRATTITSLRSAPMTDLVAEVLRQSDNNGAELITKELGLHTGGAPTTAAGVAATRAALQADGLPVDQLSAVDGSGLDRADRASCQLIMDVLERSGPNGALAKGLPIAGQTGTLEKRLIGTPAAGRVEAKTGRLEGVSALSGFVLPATPAPPGTTGQTATTGERSADVAFSLIINNVPSMAGDALADKIGVLLTQYPQAPPAAQFGPLPPG